MGYVRSETDRTKGRNLETRWRNEVGPDRRDRRSMETGQKDRRNLCRDEAQGLRRMRRREYRDGTEELIQTRQTY